MIFPQDQGKEWKSVGRISAHTSMIKKWQDKAGQNEGQVKGGYR